MGASTGEVRRRAVTQIVEVDARQAGAGAGEGLGPRRFRDVESITITAAVGAGRGVGPQRTAADPGERQARVDPPRADGEPALGPGSCRRRGPRHPTPAREARPGACRSCGGAEQGEVLVVGDGVEERRQLLDGPRRGLGALAAFADGGEARLATFR